jgi:excisionase family DNA binding protein
LEGPELLTLEELAQFFGVRRETLWHWRRTQGFPAGLRVGTVVRIERAAVEAWINRRPTSLRREGA